MTGEKPACNVRIIPATKPVVSSAPLRERHLRVAAYCRVSTDSEEQINSYKAQKEYYSNLIAGNPNWESAGIFADEGISGTSLKKREQFNRMIAACKRGRIDLIITKSLSRFARNTVDCLETVRMLKSRNIGVLFEKENINTLTESSEFLITLHSSFAQAESESISKNVAWGKRKSMEAGNVPIQYSKLLGYRKGPDGLPEIVPEEAETVKQIYRWYIGGYSLAGIVNELEARQMKNAAGNTKWSRNTVQSILSNEKYIGDAIMQKTYVVDCISKEVRKNNGELPMIVVENHHEPIIARTVFQWVQTEMKRRTSKRKVMQKTAKSERGRYNSKYSLTERLVCGECGSFYKRCTWTAHGRRRVVWRCVSRLEFGTKVCHNSPTLDEPDLHQTILNAVNQYVSQKQARQKAEDLIDTVVAGDPQAGQSFASMQAEVAGITAEQERLLDAILDDMDNPELNARMQSLTDQKAMLLDAIERRKEENKSSEIATLRMEKISAWIAAHPIGLQSYDDGITRRLIERITVMDPDTLRFKFVDETEEQNIQLQRQ